MNKTVLITGASSGIGRACAMHLDGLGFSVYAGIRRSSDSEYLMKESSERLKPIMIDVTNADSIAQAKGQIESEVGHLDALVNNAGVGLGGALEVTPLEEIRKLLDVNVLGLLAVTKAFLPMLRASKGRIINIGSTASYLASPGASVYSASKFAVRAIADSLRLELHPFGMKVMLVSPGAIESAIWEKGKSYREALLDKVDPHVADQYGALRRWGDSLYTVMKRIPAIEVAKVVAEAMTSKRPKRYYIVGKDAKGAKKATHLPTAWLDRIILSKIEKFAQKSEPKTPSIENLNMEIS